MATNRYSIIARVISGSYPYFITICTWVRTSQIAAAKPANANPRAVTMAKTDLKVFIKSRSAQRPFVPFLKYVLVRGEVGTAV